MLAVVGRRGPRRDRSAGPGLAHAGAAGGRGGGARLARRRLRVRGAGLAGLRFRALATQPGGWPALPALHERSGGGVFPHRPAGSSAPRTSRPRVGPLVRRGTADAARRRARVRELLRGGRAARIPGRPAGAPRGRALRLWRGLDPFRLDGAPTMSTDSIAVLPFTNLSGEP